MNTTIIPERLALLDTITLEKGAHAARAAAGAALKPTVEALQTSALELLNRMIDPDVAA
jgi:uncharacterized protein YjgD (DUF1641 family)